ncbi:MAG: serine/threonine-protein kinase, partial [Candidatus Obscuribacterales bacterium]|nr:serine/threonine-protein kinase [Candidatus Obscuribacterales bacterium]
SELIHEKHRFEKKEAIKIILQACHGLKHAHARGVVHRDIKPGNMVLANEKDGSQSLKIVDFGIAKLARDDEAGVDLTRTGDIFGTPKYMSPEQCRGKKVDKRSDIYSLGCVFYEILTGKAPFESDTAIELLMMHANQQADLNHPSLTAGLKAILFKTLAKDPENRYQSTEELARDLDLYLKGRDPDSLGSYRRARLGRWLNLKTTAIALLLIGLPLGAITVKENLWQKPTPIGMSEQYTQIIKDGDTAIGAARFEQAENLYHKAVSLAKTGKDRSASEKLQIEALARLSKVYEKTGQNHKKDANDSRIRALLKSAIADTTDIVEDKRDWYSALPSDDTLAHGVERARLLKDKSQEFISFGNYKTAERLEREVLALQEKWLGEDNPAIPVTLNQLGVIVVTQGKVAEAKPLWERGLSLAQKNLPASSPATPLLWANLGRMFQHEENNEKAELYFQTAISLAKKNIGKGSPSHLAALKDYAAFLNGTKRLDAASKVDQEIKHLLGK